jgi:hypothetical protein
MQNSIFVQMASYRDPELVPTLVDLIERAAYPEALRIVVCRQHALTESVGRFFVRGFLQRFVDTQGAFPVCTLTYRGATVELIEVPHQRSEGACWARNLIQQRYRGERYTLQLDSHHRFVDEWDTASIAMLESLRPFSAKPVLTAYLPGYAPGSTRDTFSWEPLAMYLLRFTPEGVVLFRPAPIAGWENLALPVPARFYSGHFAFADGHFASSVQHDPAFFFHGEEISISVRAFTHGYDLYHPHRVVAWHEYTRKDRVKIWNDHTADAKATGAVTEHWGERDERSHTRNRVLLGVDGEHDPDMDFGPYGLGTERSLAQYERYAGLSFACRGVQPALLEHASPIPGTPAHTSGSEPGWKATLRRAHDARAWAHRSRFESVLAHVHTCRITAYDGEDTALHRETLEAGVFRRHIPSDWFDYRLVFTSGLEQRPAYYLIELFDASGERLVEIKRSI